MSLSANILLAIAALGVGIGSPETGAGPSTQAPVSGQGTASPDLTATYAFKDKDVASIDQKHLADGLLILLDASGKPIYEYPIQPREGWTFADARLTPKHVYVLLQKKNSYLTKDNALVISARRPSAETALKITEADVERYGSSRYDKNKEEVYARLIADLPNELLPAEIRSNAQNMVSVIAKKRTDGTYLASSDAEPDIKQLISYIAKALNGALNGSFFPDMKGLRYRSNSTSEYDFHRDVSYEERLVVQFKALGSNANAKRLRAYFGIKLILAPTRVGIGICRHMLSDRYFAIVNTDRIEALNHDLPSTAGYRVTAVAYIPGFETGDHFHACSSLNISIYADIDEDIVDYSAPNLGSGPFGTS